MKDDFNILIDINHSFSTENDKLKKRIKSSENDDNQDGCSKVTKKRSIEKRIVRNRDSDEFNSNSMFEEQIEMNEKAARVC